MRKHHCLAPECKEPPDENGFCALHWKRLLGPRPSRILARGATSIGIRITDEARTKLEGAASGIYRSAYAVGSRVLERISAEDIKKLL